MDKKSFGQLDMSSILDEFRNAAARAKQEGEEAGRSFWDGFDDGYDSGYSSSIRKIKASTIKTEDAFKSLTEKIKKQRQQLSSILDGKNMKLNIDFSDIDLNSDVIKSKINDIISKFKSEGIIEFDAKGSEQQFKNLITLYVKYVEKIDSLRQNFTDISVPEDAIKNLKEQYLLATKIREIYDFLGGQVIDYRGEFSIAKQLKTIQNLSSQPTGKEKQLTGSYEELSKILLEIKSSLKVISDVFGNETNAMQSMADKGVTSFKSLSEAIVSVYDNLSRVESVVNSISKKDFNIQSINQIIQGDGNINSIQQQRAVARDMLDHVNKLYGEAYDTLGMFAQKGRKEIVLGASLQLSEFDPTSMAKSVKKADTEMKLANVLAEMQDYIDKLTKINELRNQYGLGEWKDTYVQTQQLTIQPETHEENANAMKEEADAQKELNEAQKQNVSAQANTEAQQMWQLKAAIDAVSQAIGRKNAGFVKEKEIVDSTIAEEVSRIKELITELSNVLPILGNIKVKFEQSFVIPELDKGNLQTTFDEIYNKFIELKDKIGTLELNVGINSDNISSAIKEALYAKEIAANYKQITQFDQLYDEEKQFKFPDDLISMKPSGDPKWINKVSGKDFTDRSEAERDFQNYKNQYIDNNNQIIGSINDVLNDLIHNLSFEDNQNQSDWAKVIVEAINTQGGNIVQALKIIPSQEATDKVEDTELINAFQLLSKTISNWIEGTNNDPENFFKDLVNEDISSFRPEMQNVFKTLGLASSDNKWTYKLADTGGAHNGVAIGNNHVVAARSPENSEAEQLKPLLDQANELGAVVPKILSVFETADNIFELQTKMPGKGLHEDTNRDFTRADDKQIDQLLHTIDVISKLGLYPDFDGPNVLYDQAKGFSVIDLGTKPESYSPSDNTFDKNVEFFLSYLERLDKIVNTEDLRDKIRTRAAMPAAQRLVNADTVAAGQINLEDAEQKSPTEVKLTPTMDEGAVAKVVEENVAQTPVTVKITPVVEGAEESAKKEETNAAEESKAFADAAKSKKEFTEANKEVAKSARESAEKVKDEAEAAEEANRTMEAIADTATQPNGIDFNDTSENLAKITYKLDDNGNKTSEAKKYKSKNDEQKVNQTRTIFKTFDENGEIKSSITQLELDLESYEKDALKIKEAQAKLQNFLSQFDNKTMNQGRKLKGYAELKNSAYSENFGIDDIEKAKAGLANLDAEFNKVVQSFRKGSSSMNPFVNAINSMDKLDSIIKKTELSFQSMSEKPEAVAETVNGLRPSYELLKEMYRLIEEDSPDANIYEFAKAFGELKVNINSAKDAIDIAKKEQKLEQDAKLKRKGYEILDTTFNEEQLSNAEESLMRLFGQINSEQFNGNAQFKGITQAAQGVKNLTFVVNDGTGALNTYSLALDTATGATGLLQKKTQPALTTLEDVAQRLKKDFTGLGRYLIGGSGIYKVAQYIRQGIQSVRDLDTALTELKKVTDETEETYDRFLQTASTTAAKIGSTMRDFVSSTADWARLNI